MAKRTVKKKVVNATVENGLETALNLSSMQSNPFNMGMMGSVQLSQLDTLFKNNRWYLASNFRQLMSELYVENGLVQTIVDVPVDDGFRGGIEIQTKQLNEEEIADLVTHMDKEDDLEIVAQACKWNRLFGGAGIIIMNGDLERKQPFSAGAIKKGDPLGFKAVDMWELFWSKQKDNNLDQIADAPGVPTIETYDYYGHPLHHSRVMQMKGIEAPSFIRPKLRGWGVSVVETLVRSINQYLKSNNLSFEVLDEFKLDIYKIKGFNSALLRPDGENSIQKRVQLANQQKNYQNALSMDSEDDYIQKQLSFSGLAEVMKEIRIQVACDMRIPMTKLFGISASGFNSGDDDIEVYNSMVESSVRKKAKAHLMEIVLLRCQQQYGMMPSDLKISFKPLRVLSAEQEENVKTQKFNRLLAAKQAYGISDEEFRDGCNRDNLLPIQLDAKKEMLMPDAGEPDDDKDGGNE